jgi:chromosome segregation ATPase
VSRIWSFVYPIALAISLFASDMAFQPGALAQDQSAYSAQIAAFTQKFETARSTQADLNRRVTCLDQRSADLVKQRDDLQRRLGQLLTEETTLSPKVQTAEAAYKQYRTNFEAEQKKVAELKNAIENMPGRIAYERWKKACASTDYWDKRYCANQLRTDFGRRESIGRDLDAARRREQIALDSMNAERRNLEESERQLTTTRAQLNSNGSEIKQTETALVSVSKTLADVRGLVQPLRIKIDEFANALNEAKDVNPEIRRRNPLAKLNDIATNIDAAVAGSREAVSRADQTLGAEWMKSCRVS